MSDTIKLIIEIPKDVYKARQHLVANKKWMVGKVDIAIANGTPLDDVKAEIQRTITASWHNEANYRNDYIDGLNDAIEILNNIGKAESEDKE